MSGWGAGARRSAIVAIAALALVLPLVAQNDYYLRLANWAAVTMILVFSLNLIYGYTGQISLGHVGFYGIGAYTAAILMVKLGLGFWLALLAAVLLCMVAGLIIGIPTLRLRHFYLAVATLAFGIIVRVVLNRWIPVTEGPSGILGIPRPKLFGLALASEIQFYYFILALLAAVTYAFYRLIESSFGRGLKAIRDNEVAAESLGVDATKFKVIAFVLSAGLAGAAGALFATLNGFVGPSSFTEEHSIILLALLIVCGRGTYLGPILAGLFLVVIPELLRDFGSYQQWVYSIVLVLVIFKMPMGIGGYIERLFPGPKERLQLEPAAPQEIRSRTLSGPAGGVQLHLRGVSRTFGGLAAVSKVDLQVNTGDLIGLIGPNGAGKTTLINLVTGAIKPSAGSITMHGEHLERHSMSNIARRGLVRTFQTPRLFENMTLLENVLIGVDRSAHAPSLMFSQGEDRRRRARAARILEEIGLGALSEARAGSVPFGQRRLLEVARALACRPQMLMLDEPAAGLHSMEISTLEKELRRISDSGITVILVEHNIGLVMRTCSRVVVLKAGKKLAEGTPAEIAADPAVIDAYLGTAQ